MTKLNWIYAAKGHYSAREGDWTVHVLENGAVYKTHPSRATADVTGAKADKYVESAQTKFPVRGKRRAKPDPDPKDEKETPMKETKATTPKKRATKKQITAAAKKLAKGAGAIIGTTRAFVTEVGEAEQRECAKRKAPPPKKTVKPKKAVKPKKKVKPEKKAKPATRRTVPVPVTDHPLQYLISGGAALPPTRRKATGRRREQTLEEYMGF